MTRSMTGFGKKTLEDKNTSIEIEIRSVNNRSLKIISKLPEAISPYRNALEKAIRERISRGTVYLVIKYQSRAGTSFYKINEHLIKRYIDELRILQKKFGLKNDVMLSQMLTLPGIVEIRKDADLSKDFPSSLKAVLKKALSELIKMRKSEGKALSSDIGLHCKNIKRHLIKVRQLVPLIAEDYRKKLKKRANTILKESDITVKDKDLIKEIVLFSQHSDISEEIVRLKSHIKHILSFMNKDEPKGRRLEFIAQEMLREANTMGSKAQGVQLSKLFVEIKSEIDKIREQTQNIE